MSNLKNRVADLELRAGNMKKLTPALVYLSHLKTLEQAKAEYRQKYGFDLPADGQIIELVACDMSKEGGGRPLPRQTSRRSESD